MRRIAIILCTLLCIVGMVGCSPMSEEEREAERAAEVELAEAQELYDAQDYESAAEIAKSIVSDYPDTSSAKQAKEILEEYAGDLIEQERQAYKEEKWSTVISLNGKIISAVPHSDIAEESQKMANEARSVIKEKSEKKANERAEERERLKAEQEQERENLSSKFKSNYDEVNQITWYLPSDTPQYVGNSCYIYMGEKKYSYTDDTFSRDVSFNTYWLRWRMSYTGDDWIFFDKITFNIDGKNYYKTFDYSDVIRDAGGGNVYEIVDINVEESDIEILNAIASSDQAILRFQGDAYWYDKTVTQAEKNGIQSILETYNILNVMY